VHAGVAKLADAQDLKSAHNVRAVSVRDQIPGITWRMEELTLGRL